MDRQIANILLNGEVGAKTQNFGCFLILSPERGFEEFQRKADFIQLVITLPKETENPL